MQLYSRLTWSSLFLACLNTAHAAPYEADAKDVALHNHAKKDIVIEAGSGDINIVINQIAAATTTATVTATVPGCAGSGTAAANDDGGSGRHNVGSGSGSDVPGSNENVLHPILPGGQRYAHPSACAPQPSATMWFGSDGNADNPGRKLAENAVLEIPNLTYPAVNAHQVDSIGSVVCKGSSATVQFTSSQAYDIAQKTWTGEFTIITYSDTCGTGQDGTHDFILVKSVSKGPDGSLTLICFIQYITFEHAVGSTTNMTVTIGTTYNTTTPTTGGSGPSPSGNASNPFPAACLAEEFDNNLDAAAGDTISLADPAFWDSVAPTTTADDWDGDFETDDLPDIDDQNFARHRRTRRRSRARSLKKRGAKEWFAKKLKQVGGAIRDVTVAVVGGAYDAAKEGLKKVLDVANEWTSVNKDLGADLSFNNYPSNGVSPFRAQSGYKFFDDGDLSVWCVQCGAQSTLQSAGRIVFSIRDGFSAGNVRVFGRLEAGVFLGLAGTVAKTVPIAETTFFQLTLGDAILPGILKLGPSIRIGAGAQVNFEASGTLYAGAKTRWENVDVSLDVITVANSYANGLIPALDPEFEVDGSLQITLDAHLTLAVGITVGILNDKFSRSIEVIDQPGLQVTAGIEGSASFNGGFSSAFTGDCAGIALGAFVYNNVTADIAKLTSRTLFAWRSSGYKKCFPIGGSGAAADNGSDDNNGDADGDGDADAGANVSADARKRSIAASPFKSIVHGVKRKPLQIAAPASNGAGRAAPRPPYLKPRQGFSNATGSASANDTNNSAFAGGLSFAAMVTTDGDLELHWSNSGNVYVIESNADTDTNFLPDGEFAISTEDETGLFGAVLADNSTSRIIVGDADGGVFHGYIDELDRYGVSRLRVHPADFLPRTSRVVAFDAVNDVLIAGDGPDLLVAFDSAQNLYYPVMCVYDSCYTKVFLAKDPELGPATLQNLTAITGEADLQCAVIPLTAASILL